MPIPMHSIGHIYGAAVVDNLNDGVFCVNDSVAITRGRDKLRPAITVQERIVCPSPDLRTPLDEIKDLIKMVGHTLVIKF